MDLSPAAVHFAHDLVVIRHGQTDWNVAGRYQGREDIPLNDTGRRQARRNGAALRRHLDAVGLDPDRFDWVASPLARAAETMRLVRESAGLDPDAFRTDERLVELDFGRWSGLTAPEIAAADPAGWAARRKDAWGHPPPGGESHAMATARIRGVLDGLASPTVVVLHGGVNRVLKVLLGALAADAAPAFHTPQDRFYTWTSGTVTWI